MKKVDGGRREEEEEEEEGKGEMDGMGWERRGRVAASRCWSVV